MKCKICGEKVSDNICIGCRRELPTNRDHFCEGCSTVIKLNIEYDKKIRKHGIIPPKWDQIMKETLDFDVLCDDCHKDRMRLYKSFS